MLWKVAADVVGPHKSCIKSSSAVHDRKRFHCADSSVHYRLLLNQLLQTDSRSDEQYYKSKNKEIVRCARHVKHIELGITNRFERLRRRVFQRADPVYAELHFRRRTEIAEICMFKLVIKNVVGLDKRQKRWLLNKTIINN